MGRGGGLDKIVEYFVFFHCTLQMQFLNDVFQNKFFLEYSLFSYIDIHEGTDRICMHVVSVSLVFVAVRH